MATRTKRIWGFGLMIAGAGLLAPALFAGSASAWAGSCFDSAPPGHPWTELRVDTSGLKLAELTSPAGAVATDHTLTVTLTSPKAADTSQPVTLANVGGVSFNSTVGVAAAYVGAGQTDDRLVLYPTPVTAGMLTSLSGHSAIDHITFCYTAPAPVVTTTTPPTTVAPTTSVQPVVIGEIVTAPTTTTTVPTEVLAETETPAAVAPEIAFTGSSSEPLVLFGGGLLAVGLGLVVLERLGLLRRGLHSK